MTDENTTVKEVEASDAPESTEAPKTSDEIKLSGIYAFKEGMSSIYSEDGRNIPVTVLRYQPWIVSQIKTDETDGYSALQIASGPKKSVRSTSAEIGHLKGAGFENGAYFKREVRQNIPEGAKVGLKVSIESLEKGDKVTMTSKSKGHGFSGAMKRHGFAGGPATHGSGFHRRPGSIGNCEFPGRVMPGRKMPGHFGVETVTMRNVEIADVIPEENVVLIKGAVPGSKNSIIKLMKA